MEGPKDGGINFVRALITSRFVGRYKMIKSSFNVLLASLLLSSQALSLTPAAKTLVQLETKANGASLRSDQPIPMPHFEIPVEYLQANFADRIRPDILKHLIFNKNGKNYLRWILNPEDTMWSNKVAEYFRTKGLLLQKEYYFTGYQTASRSYIVEDPAHETQFSVKSSTNKTGGNWSDKKQPVGEAIDSRLNADFLADIQNKLAFKNIIILDEPAIFGIGAIDQAVVIRDLGPMNDAKSEMIYVPGFSVLHEDIGLKIAALNGAKNVRSYWRENYVKPVARALGEFAARTGMAFDSPHSQNFLVEMTKDYKPTGRIVFRDLADLYIHKNIATAIHSDAESYFKSFHQKENLISVIAGSFGPLHGNKFPSWMSKFGYSQWKKDYYSEFEKTFEAESQIPVSEFKQKNGRMSGRYFSNYYQIPKNEATKGYWRNMFEYQTPKGNLNCSYIFMM